MSPSDQAPQPANAPVTNEDQNAEVAQPQGDEDVAGHMIWPDQPSTDGRSRLGPNDPK